MIIIKFNKTLSIPCKNKEKIRLYQSVFAMIQIISLRNRFGLYFHKPKLLQGMGFTAGRLWESPF